MIVSRSYLNQTERVRAGFSPPPSIFRLGDNAAGDEGCFTTLKDPVVKKQPIPTTGNGRGGKNK